MSSYFAAAKGGPVCLQHNVKMNLHRGLKPYFKCNRPECEEEAHYEPPTCERCLKPMKLCGTRERTYYWRCEEDRLSQQFHKEIRSVGTSDKLGPPPSCPRHKAACVLDENHSETTLVHFSCPRDCEYSVAVERAKCEKCCIASPGTMQIYGGPWWFGWECKHHPKELYPFVMCGCEEKGWDHYHSNGVGMNIQRCDDCRKFADDNEAAKAHHKICMCELTPRVSIPEDLQSKMVGDARTAVWWPKDEEAVTEMNKELKGWFYGIEKAIGHPITIKTAETPLDNTHYKLERAMDDRKDACRENSKPSSFGSETSITKDPTGDFGYRASNRPSHRYADKPMVPCIFTEEQMASVGFRPLKMADGAIVTGKTGRPHGVLAELPKTNAGREEAVQDLCKAVINLLGQLNEMRFDDHSIKEQHRIESVRRAALTALRVVTKNPCSKDSVERDKLATVIRETFALAGGFRVSEIEKLEDEEVLQGKCFLDGIYHHIQFVRVQTVDGEQKPVLDPHHRYYDGVGRFNDSHMRTVEVPGFKGEYVLFIYPSER